MGQTTPIWTDGPHMAHSHVAHTHQLAHGRTCRPRRMCPGQRRWRPRRCKDSRALPPVPASGPHAVTGPPPASAELHIYSAPPLVCPLLQGHRRSRR